MANTPIIPGVPTPINGDPKCALTLCGKIIAQVDCIIVIMQGTDGCIDIQFFDKDGKLLDLSKYTEIQIMLYNEFDCTVANFWWPSIPTGCKGLLMTNTYYSHLLKEDVSYIYVNNNNVFVYSNEKVKQITKDGSYTIVNGKSVHRDEFGIHKGTYWSPNGSALAYYRMDQR